VKPERGPIYSERYPAPNPYQNGAFDIQPTEAPVESIPTAWGDVPSQTHEAHTGHPDGFQGVTVEVANLSPTVFIPDQIQGEARDQLLEWKANMEASLEAERTKYHKVQEDRTRAGATSPIDLM
jgi:hypothetical protein